MLHLPAGFELPFVSTASPRPGRRRRGFTAATAVESLEVRQLLSAVGNTPPVADAVAITTEEDTAVDGVVTASDIDGDVLTYAIAVGAEPAHGEVVLDAATGAFHYTPVENYNGDDAFLVSVDDGCGGVVAATVSITVTPVNDPPTAFDLTLKAEAFTAINGYVGVPVRNRVIFDGDSLTRGLGASTPGGTYVSQVAPLLGPGWETRNLGIGGQMTMDVLADAATQIDSQFDASLNANVVCLWIGSNDIWQQLPANETYARIVEYSEDRQAAGFKVVVGSVMPRNLTPYAQTQRQELNALLREHWQEFADGFADFAAEPRLQNYLDTDYFADKVHPTDAGYAIVAPIATAAIQQALPAAAPPAATLTDVDGDAVTATLLDGPLSGGVSIDAATGLFSYVPGGPISSDSFTVLLDDGHGQTATATVTLEIAPPNDKPRPGRDVLRASQGEIAGLDLFANDHDADGDPITLTGIVMPPELGAALTVTSDGVLKFDGTALPASAVALDHPTPHKLWYTETDGHGAATSGVLQLWLSARRSLVVTGSGPGTIATLKFFDPLTDATTTIQPYADRLNPYWGGLKVAAGDFTGDGITDAAVAAWRGGEPRVKIYNGATGTLFRTLRPFGSSYSGGFELSAGDLDGDGRADLFVGRADGATQVLVYDVISTALLNTFDAFPEGIPSDETGGVHIAAADVTGDGLADLLVSPGGLSARPLVRVLDGASGTLVREVAVFPASFRGGVSVAGGDVDGDGYGDIIAVAATWSDVQTRVVSGLTGDLLHSFAAFGPSVRGAGFAAAGDVNGDGRSEFLVAHGTSVRAFDGSTGLAVGDFTAPAGAARAHVAGDAPLVSKPATTGAATPLLGGGDAPSPPDLPLTIHAAVVGLRQTAAALASAGLSAAATEAVGGVTIRFGGLPGSTLAAWQNTGLNANSVVLAPKANGRGWFLGDIGAGFDDVGHLIPPDAAVGRYDLLTALAHALTGKLGVPTPTQPTLLTGSVLNTGTRHLLPGRTLEQLFGSDPSTWLLI